MALQELRMRMRDADAVRYGQSRQRKQKKSRQAGWVVLNTGFLELMGEARGFLSRELDYAVLQTGSRIAGGDFF